MECRMERDMRGRRKVCVRVCVCCVRERVGCGKRELTLDGCFQADIFSQLGQSGGCLGYFWFADSVLGVSQTYFRRGTRRVAPCY